MQDIREMQGIFIILIIQNCFLSGQAGRWSPPPFLAPLRAKPGAAGCPTDRGATPSPASASPSRQGPLKNEAWGRAEAGGGIPRETLLRRLRRRRRVLLLLPQQQLRLLGEDQGRCRRGGEEWKGWGERRRRRRRGGGEKRSAGLLRRILLRDRGVRIREIKREVQSSMHACFLSPGCSKDQI